jgi:hypothetical protein
LVIFLARISLHFALLASLSKPFFRKIKKAQKTSQIAFLPEQAIIRKMVNPKTPESFAIKQRPLQKNRFRPAKTCHFRFLFSFSSFSLIISSFRARSFSLLLHTRVFVF